MVINTNSSATNASRLLADSSTRLSKSLARLSSGSKIVSPEDDAAGLAQSIKFDAQINRNNAVSANIGNMISFSQTQDGFMQKVQKALDRMSEISVLSQDATKTNADLSNYNSEFTQLQNYISDIQGKKFNGVALFADQANSSSNYVLGQSNWKNLSVTIDSDGATMGILAVGFDFGPATGILNAYSGISVSTSTAAATALKNLKTAIQALAQMRALVGANLQRLNFTQEQVSLLNENLQASNSRIKDVDVAEESTNYARQNILVQSGTAMLAQANALPQAALRLLG